MLGALLYYFIYGFLSYKAEQYREKARKGEEILRRLNSGEHGHKEHDEQ